MFNMNSTVNVHDCLFVVQWRYGGWAEFNIVRAGIPPVRRLLFFCLFFMFSGYVL